MIRNASANDAESICNIYNYYIKNSIATFEESLVTPVEMASRINKTISRFPFLVAVEGKQVTGFAYATEWKPRAAYKFTVETSVYVDHLQTGNGFGKNLYLRLIEMLKKYGFKNAIGSISLPNEASIKLHEQLGFKKAGVFKKTGLKFGQWVDVGCWQLSL